MVISIAGVGYVGLSLAVLLAKKNKVIAVDILEEKVNKINQRLSPIQDAYLEKYLTEEKLDLNATLDAESAYKIADIIIIAVPTNYNMDLNYFDTSAIEKTLDIVNKVNSHALIVIKSTVPIGYTKNIAKKYSNLEIIFSPEFLRESKALYDNFYPSRIIIGKTANTKNYLSRASEFAKLLKDSALKKDVPIIFMNSTEAEAVKLFSNTFLALRIAYFNELDSYAEMQGLDTKAIIEGVSLDPRIGNFYNNPSFGYGGYCLPKDTMQLKANYKNIPEKLITAVTDSNITRKNFVANRIFLKLKNCKNKIVGIYRLTMKTNSDSFRQSAILDVINILKSKGVEIIIFEPLLNEKTYLDCKVISNFDEFTTLAELIIANRYDNCLNKIKNKVYTRDIFNRD